MAQFIFQAKLLKSVEPLGTRVNASTGELEPPFYFLGRETGNFCNVIRIKNRADLLNEDYVNIDENNVLADTILKVGNFIHTPFRIIDAIQGNGGLFSNQVGIGIVQNPAGKKETSNVIPFGTKIVALRTNDMTDENGEPFPLAGTDPREDDEIDIVLNQSVGEAAIAGEEQGCFICCVQEFINKTRKASIGLDASKPQRIESLVPLFSTDGTPLTDDFGNQLVAETSVALIEKIQAANSTLVNVNKGAPSVNNLTGNLKIEEQFAVTSEVSNTLLGIPRAETQLSLFSDVSTLGFDGQAWEVFKSLEPGRVVNRPWETRPTKDGFRYNAKLVENLNEQALELTGFPVPYIFPWDATNVNNHIPSQHKKFERFILLGNYLYRYYETLGASFIDDFLNPAVCSMEEVDISRERDSQPTTGTILKYAGAGTTETGRSSAYRAIDIWTDTFTKIKNGIYPNATEANIASVLFDGVLFDSIVLYLTNGNFTNTANEVRPSSIEETTLVNNGLAFYYAPGYEWPNNSEEEIILQTKETYRYQPGRISGFTFGTKTDVVSSAGGTSVEWGVENETDGYLFRLSAGQLQIVRRSTVPLSDTFLRDERLTGRQELKTGIIDKFTGAIRPDFHELAINQREWNGDTLDGNGPTGYTIDPATVTMWKIEFSWYGAIGARFYAYIPVDNGEARWVLIHTIVIENKLMEACLEDPFFRMKYSFNLRNREISTRQQFVYKYGSSVYIDGGDRGNTKQFNYTGEKKTSQYNTFVPLLGIKSKEKIFNRDGIGRKSRKIAYPTLLNVNTSEFTKFEIIQCEACPGFGFTYDDGLKAKTPQNATNPKKINFNIISNTWDTGGLFGAANNEIQYIRLTDYSYELHKDSPPAEDNVGFTPDDDDAAILVPGFGKRYIDYYSTITDFSAASSVNKEQFVFADTDLRSPTGLIDTSTKTITSDNQGVSFDIDSSVLNRFDLPIGSIVQVKINFDFDNVDQYEQFDVVLENSSGVATSSRISLDTNNSPIPSTDPAEYTFRLSVTGENTTRIALKADEEAGSPALDYSPAIITNTDVNITGIRLSEFKITRIVDKELTLDYRNTDGTIKETTTEPPTIPTPIFMGGDALMYIGDVDTDNNSPNEDINYKATSLTDLESRVRIILEQELGGPGNSSGFDADSPASNVTLTMLQNAKNAFVIKKGSLYIKRKYFDGNYDIDSPPNNSRAEQSPFVPYKEYTWFIGNKATLSPINKVYAASSITIGSDAAEIRFLNPNTRNELNRTSNSVGNITGKYTTEFRIAFTNINPATEPNKLPREKDLLFLDYDRPLKGRQKLGESFDGNSDTRGGLNNLVETFQLDYRIKEIPNEGLINGGVCSLVKIQAADRQDFSLPSTPLYSTKSAFLSAFNSGVNSLTADYPTSTFDHFTTNLLVIEDQNFINIAFDTNNNYERKITFSGGELGLNGNASGVTFQTEAVFFQFTNSTTGITSNACVIQISDEGSPVITGADKLTLSFVELLYTYNNVGGVFLSKKKVFGFDPFPLYPIIFTRYGAQINNINFKNGNIVSSPSWTIYGNDISIFEPLSSNQPGYVAPSLATTKNPENFEEQDQLSTLLIDKSADKRLRRIFTPGDSLFGERSFHNGALAAKVGNTTNSKRVERLTSFYTGGDGSNFDTDKVDLTDVFGEDRNKIQQDFRNSLALFIVGEQPTDDSPEGSNNGTFQASLNTSEI